jgi:predicted transcriptional regulator
VAGDAVEKKPFPYMSVATWATLRRAFFKNVPSKVTKNYLATALSVSEGTAGNILPQLRNIGLIDKDGVPTELGKEFRFDTSYAAVCKTIVTSIYPDELRDLFPDADADVDSVAHWFMRHSGSGLASSKYPARFYLHLVSGELPSEELLPRAAKSSKSTTTPKAASKVTQPSVAHTPPVQEAVETHPQATPAHAKPRHQDGPSLHIDMQVHIDPAATPEQIDSIFASMAKHLYGR